MTKPMTDEQLAEIRGRGYAATGKDVNACLDEIRRLREKWDKTWGELNSWQTKYLRADIENDKLRKEAEGLRKVVEAAHREGEK